MEEGDLEMMEDSAEPTKSPVSQAVPSLVVPLLALIQPTPLSFPPSTGGPSPHPPTTSVLSAIHICALECLNNIFLSLASPARTHAPLTTPGVDRDSGAHIWSELWLALAAVGTNIRGPGQERRGEMWAAAIGVLWGIANVWKGVLVSMCSR